MAVDRFAATARRTRRRTGVVLAGFGCPRANATITSADLYDAIAFGRFCYLPIEAVATELTETAALIPILFQRIHHRRGVVFGVRAGQYHAIVLEQLVTFRIQLDIRDDVVFKTLLLQPVG